MNAKKHEINIDEKAVEEAFKVLKQAMHNDPAYAYSWHANIAMAMYDSFPEVFWLPTHDKLHKIANEGASRFMGQAFDVITSGDMLEDD